MRVPYVEAINDALKEEMRRDGKIVLHGEDVAESGGIFGELRGLQRRGERALQRGGEPLYARPGADDCHPLLRL